MDYPKSLPDVYLHDGKFTDGTADGAVGPSRDPAAWANAVTDSILIVQDAGGLEPDEADPTQLLQAIQALIALGLASISLAGYARLTTAQIWTRPQSSAGTALADAATVVIDLAVDQVFTLTLGGNRMIGFPAHIPDAVTYFSVVVTQPAAGGPFVPAFAAGYHGVASITFSTAAGARDHLVFRAVPGSVELTDVRNNVGG